MYKLEIKFPDRDTLEYIKGEIENLCCDNESEQDEDVLKLNEACIKVTIREDK